MAESSLDQVATERPLEIEWKAFELRPGGAMPDPHYAEMVASRWPTVQRMAREQYDVEMRSHRFGLDTRLAHEGAKFVRAAAPDRERAYHEAIFRAHFIDDADFDRLDVLVEIVRGVGGIDADAFHAALERGDYRAAVLAEERFAAQAGISGVPAFVINDKYLLSGVRPPEQLHAELTYIQQQEGEHP